ncbi:MAG: YdcF family protein [Opitutaceae bacterium]
MPPSSDDGGTAARILYDYLSTPDTGAPAVCDAVIGFGVFDLRIAALCGALHADGRARRIIFTGGIGAGTADLGRPEADAFADELARLYPAVERASVVIENRSTNTGENVRFTLDLIARNHPELTPGTGLRTALLVASPARLRRVRLTWKHHAPSVSSWALAPASTFEHEHAQHTAKHLDYPALLAGEIDRIRDYPARGWIASEPIPAHVLAARDQLARS